MQFWITRDAEDGSAAQPIAPVNAIWAAPSNATFSALNRFPATPLRPAALVAHQFRINATNRANHTFTARMSDGYSTTFGPAANAQTTAYTPGQIQSWLDDGTPNHLPIYTFTAMVDPTRMLTLQDNMGGSPIGVPADTSPTDWFAPWVPMHTVPPTDPTITLHLPATRVSDSFRLRHPVADGWSSQIGSYLGLGISSPIQFSGLYGMAPYSIQFDSLTLANPTPYVSGPFVLDDLTTAETHGSILHAGFNDLSDWFVPPHPVNLQISSSRQGHQLAIQHPDGEFFPIQNGSTAGSTSGPPGQPPWYQDYFYFDATAIARSEMPWYVVDNDTGERIGFAANQNHPANGALIDWIAVPPPGTLTGGINAGGNIELQWPLANLASDQGGFEIERLLGGETLWQTIGTLAASNADTNAVLHFTDPNPVFDKVHSYRVRYTYGSGTALRHSAPSNLVVLPYWRDDDHDGLPDWWERLHFYDSLGYGADDDYDNDGVTNLEEYLAGTDPNDPTSKPYKVMRLTPDDGQIGHDTNGVVLLYLNKPLPSSVSTLPPGIVTHTADGGATWQAVAGTTMVLPGGKGIAFVPSADFIPHAAGVEEYTYRIDFTASTTGLAPVVPLHTRFSVEDPDTIGPWVEEVWPGNDNIEVAVDFAPVVQWSEPLRLDTLTAANVSLRPEGGTSDLPVTLTFDYDTNRLTIAPAAVLQPDTVYHVALTTGLKNLMGVPLLNVYQWSFQTRPEPPPPPPGGPYIAASAPEPYSTDVPIDATLNFAFSEDMDGSTITDQTLHLRAYGSESDVSVLIYYANAILIVTPRMPLSNDTRYVLAFDESAILSASATPQPLGGRTSFPFTTVPSGGGGGGGPGGPAGSKKPGKPKPVKVDVSYGGHYMADNKGGYAEAEITRPDGSKTTQKGEKLNPPKKPSVTFTVEAEDGSTIKITPKKVIASAALTPESAAPAAGAAPQTGLGGENYVVFKETETPDEWVYEGKASAGGRFDSQANEKGHFFAPIFESKDYSRGFDPPVKDSSNAGLNHSDYQTSVCATTAVNTHLPADEQQDLNINDHISAKFPNAQIAQNCEVVIKEADMSKIEFIDALPSPLLKDNLLKIKGKAQGKAEIYIYAKKQKDGKTGSERTPLATLKIDVLPKATLSLGIWKVSDSQSPDTQFNFPGNRLTEVFKAANKVYRQACIIFTEVSAQADQPNVNYDYYPKTEFWEIQLPNQTAWKPL